MWRGQVVGLVAALSLMWGCGTGEKPGAAPGGNPAAKKGPPTFPVETSLVVERQLEYSLAAVGSLIALEEAQVAARVAGTLEKVAFVEGDRVQADQVLAEIEPRRYRIAVDQAKATLDRAKANLDDARKALQRRKELGPQVAAAEEIDSAGAKFHVTEAEVAQAKAALELAELNLHDARVRAPIAGVIQSRKLQTGAYVTPGSVLATILRTEPLRLRFAVPEPDAARLQPNMTVHAKIRGVTADVTATIRHIAGRADESARLVEVLADIVGENKDLRPGAFVEVVVPIGAPYAAPVIAQSAVRPSEKGFLAFVMEGDRARERVLQLGMRTQDGLVEVKSGLRAGEMLVVTGAEALREGAQVKVAGKDAKKDGKVDLPRSATAAAAPTGAP